MGGSEMSTRHCSNKGTVEMELDFGTVYLGVSEGNVPSGKLSVRIELTPHQVHSLYDDLREILDELVGEP